MAQNKNNHAENSDFLAKRIETKLEWSDLQLPPETLHALEDVVKRLASESQIDGFKDHSRAGAPGYRVMFHGPRCISKPLMEPASPSTKSPPSCASDGP